MSVSLQDMCVFILQKLFIYSVLQYILRTIRSSKLILFH